MSDEKLPNRAIGKMYLVHRQTHGCPFAYATLTDFDKGQGLLQIHSDWGTYSAYWGAMGTDIKSFLLECSAGYIEDCLASNAYSMGMKKVCFIRLTKFMAQCWPELRKEIEKD